MFESLKIPQLYLLYSPNSSPKEMWELDIEGPDNKTQYNVSPLKTRDRRRLSRQQRT